MLVLSSQARLLRSNPLVWLCDQEPVRAFQKGPPPEKATRSSGSCESGPGQSPPSRAWSTGPARGRWKTAASSWRGGWMPQAAWEAMLADAPHPLGVHPRNLPAPQDHPYVLRRLRETLQETQWDGIRLWDIAQSPTPHTHPPSPSHKRRRTDTGGAHSTPGALRATQHDAPEPQPAAPPANPVTQQTTASGHRARPRPEDTK